MRLPLDLSLADPDNIHDRVLFPALDRIREEDPVFWSDLQHCWLLTRYDDVISAFSDKRWSDKRLQTRQFDSIPESQRAARIPNLARYVPDWLNNIDSPQHDRVRRLVVKAFNRKVIENMRPAIEKAADELISKALDLREFDFVDVVAFRFPALVIMQFLGVPLDHVGKMRGWANDITAALAGVNPNPETLLAAERSMQEMNDIFMIEIARRQKTPGPDLITALVQAREDADSLSIEELLGILQLVIVAGHDSTANSIGLGLLAMLQYPAQLEAYKQGHVEGLHAMSELLRHIAVATIQPRVALERMELRGKTIEPGQYAFVTIAAANRDPRMFDRPGELNFSRPNLDRVAVFGPGIHHCVGHHLARIELDTLFRKLFARVSRIEVTAKPEQLRFQRNIVFRGLEAMPVRVSAN